MTDKVISKTSSGSSKSITKASQEHHISITGSESCPDLNLITKAWNKLPEGVKMGIVVMVKSYLSEEEQ